MINKNIAIHKDDSTLTKLCKFCCWIALIACSLIFGTVWLILFITLGGPTCVYKLICLLYRHHENKKSRELARKEPDNNELHL